MYNIMNMDFLDELDYGWTATYNQRAVLFRILCSLNDRKCFRSQDNVIESVKFFTKGKDQHGQAEFSEIVYDCHDSFEQRPLEDFYETINYYLDSFELSDIMDISGDGWNGIVTCLDLFDFKYNDKEVLWVAKNSLQSDNNLQEAYNKLSRDQKKYVSSFMNALTTNMTDGQAITWIRELVNLILNCMDCDEYICGSGSHKHDTINTEMEIVLGDSDIPTTQMQFNSPCFSTPSSNSSSLSSLSSLNLESQANDFPPGDMMEMRRQRVVPVFCVTLPDFPGIFPLVFTLKPAHKESHALVENIQEMLSKLFFQDVVFGIVASSRSFQLSAIIKRDRNLYFKSTNSIYFYKNNVNDRVKSLDLEALNKMCSFIYSVLKWASKTRCSLE